MKYFFREKMWQNFLNVSKINRSREPKPGVGNSTFGWGIKTRQLIYSATLSFAGGVNRNSSNENANRYLNAMGCAGADNGQIPKRHAFTGVAVADFLRPINNGFIPGKIDTGDHNWGCVSSMVGSSVMAGAGSAGASVAFGPQTLTNQRKRAMIKMRKRRFISVPLVQ